MINNSPIPSMIVGVSELKKLTLRNLGKVRLPKRRICDEYKQKIFYSAQRLVQETPCLSTTRPMRRIRKKKKEETYLPKKPLEYIGHKNNSNYCSVLPNSIV
jgi:hypothetical protein